MEAILELLRAFAQDLRVRTLFALIVLDVLLAIAQAVKERKFDADRLAEFYTSMILPSLICYGALYFLVPLMAEDLLGPIGDGLGEAAITAAWGALVLQIGNSILKHLEALGLRVKSQLTSLGMRITNRHPEGDNME